MPIAELGVDRKLAMSAGRKLKRYGLGVDQYLNLVLSAVVKMPGMHPFTISNVDGLQINFPMSFRTRCGEYVAKVTTEECGYSAEVPSLPGCITEADTLQELKLNLVDAAEGWLDAREEAFGDSFAFKRRCA